MKRFSISVLSFLAILSLITPFIKADDADLLKWALNEEEANTIWGNADQNADGTLIKEEAHKAFKQAVTKIFKKAQVSK